MRPLMHALAALALASCAGAERFDELVRTPTWSDLPPIRIGHRLSIDVWAPTLRMPGDRLPPPLLEEAPWISP